MRLNCTCQLRRFSAATLRLSRAAGVKARHQAQTPWSGTDLLNTARKNTNKQLTNGGGAKWNHQAQTDDYSAWHSAQALILKTAAAA